MKIKFNNVYRMADGDGGGGGNGNQQQQQTPPDWRAGIPEDLRADAAFKDIKDIPSLAKSYLHAQRMVGADKVLRPNDKFTPEQWAEYYTAGGRPAASDKYTFKPEGLPESIQIDEAKMSGVKKTLFDAGLSDKQAKAVMGMYFGSLKEQTENYQKEQTRIQETAMSELTKVWGEDTSVKIDVAKGVLKRFGGPELAAKMETSGLGNDPHFIQMLARMGEAMLDDTASGKGSGIILGDASGAKREIDQLKTDRDFQSQLSDRQNPGHRAALDRWTKLHEAAFPQKK